MTIYETGSADARPVKAVIAGGGLAGLACAKRLIDAGLQVELVEAEAQLGGRCANWLDPKVSEDIESGVHTFFGVYSRLIALLNEVGVDDNKMVWWDDKVGFLQPGARLSIFALDLIRDLPNVIGGLLGNNRLLSPLDKLSVGLTMLNGLLRRDQYESRTVSELARDGRVSRDTYEQLLRPLCRGLAFAEPEELSAYVLLTLLNHGVLNPWNLRTGTFRGGMTDVMTGPIGDWLIENGATIHLNAPLQTIHYSGTTDGEPGQISGFELADGRRLTGDIYVSALPLEVFKTKIPSGLTELPYFQNIQEIETVPATSVQLWFDQRFVSRKEFIFLTDSPLVVFQDESRLNFPHEGSRISGQITDRKTDSYTDEQYIALALREIHHYIPASTRATLQKSIVVRHQAILIKPGTQALRPVQTSPVANFFLAGDYTRQDWFTTMEGATRSGEKAATGVLRRLGLNVDEDDDLRDVAAATGSVGARANVANAVRSRWERSAWLRTEVPRSPLAERATRTLNRIAERFIGEDD